MSYRTFLGETLTPVDLPSRSHERAVGAEGNYRGGSEVTFLTELTCWFGVATTSTWSPTLSDASTVMSFPRGIKMLVPSADFTTMSSLVNMSTSPRTCTGWDAGPDCDSAGVDRSRTYIAAYASQKLRPRSERDAMRDRTGSAAEAIGSILAA